MNKLKWAAAGLAVLVIGLGGFWMSMKDEALGEAKANGQGTVKFKAEDGVTVTADLYLGNSAQAPFILLFHQAGYSRGEYAEIAPKLKALGFNCMAVDQRSGSGFKETLNETHKSAVALNKTCGYTDAYPDMNAALDYVLDHFDPASVVVWGSSYSASLALIMASERPEEVDGVIAFSPGEYFKMSAKTVASFAASIEQPVLITSARSETRDWEAIAEAIKSPAATFFTPEGRGVHGSSALLEANENHQEYWQTVNAFLKTFQN